MKRSVLKLKDEQGTILVVALIMLTLLTLIGISASTTSQIEIQISGNDKQHKAIFYAAEAGIDHARALLGARLAANNSSNIATGVPLKWTFALLGLDETAGGGDDATGTTFATGTQWITRAIGNCSYTVTVWNNPNDATGDATTDDDSLLMIRSVATGPNGISTASIEVMLYGSATGVLMQGYPAQSGAGAGKNYTSDDLDAIDFTTASSQL
jgi:type IV pilus assembly protein PilX